MNAEYAEGRREINNVNVDKKRLNTINYCFHLKYTIRHVGMFTAWNSELGTRNAERKIGDFQ